MNKSQQILLPSHDIITAASPFIKTQQRYYIFLQEIGAIQITNQRNIVERGKNEVVATESKSIPRSHMIRPISCDVCEILESCRQSFNPFLCSIGSESIHIEE